MPQVTDLDKLVFSIHGIDEHNNHKLPKTAQRNKLLAKFEDYENIFSCSCSGAIYPPINILSQLYKY